MKDTPFGRAMLEHWLLGPDAIYLNHGTVGVTPNPVLEHQSKLRDEIERHPSRFLLRELSEIVVGERRPEMPRLRVAAEKVAAFLGARGRDLVFVDNATTGANAVLRSFPFEDGDELVITSLGYGGVNNTARFVAGKRGIELRTIEMPADLSSPGQATEIVDKALGPRSRLLVIDHICSESALLLPVRPIVEVAHEKGVRVLVDGAHAPASIPLDIPRLGADWYVGNLHKWAWAPRSCGVLWSSEDCQQGLHPAVISWGLDDGYTAQFDLVGTRDATPHLTAPFALELMSEVGVDRVRKYNHDLAWQGAQLVAARLGVEIVTPESMFASMVTLPLPDRFGSTVDDAARLRDSLLFEDGIEVSISGHASGPRSGRLWMRVAAQIYNEMGDFERLAEALAVR